MGPKHSQFDRGSLPGYESLFARFIELGLSEQFETRNREFKNRKDAAAILARTEKGLDHMIRDGRVTWIKVGGTLWVHIPTSSELLCRGERWIDLPVEK